MSLHRRPVHTHHAPEAIGPYVQAIAYRDLLFLSGQIPLDPLSKTLAGPTIEEQTTQVLANIKAILSHEGLSWIHLLKVEIFLKHLTDFPVVNQIYAKTLLSDSLDPSSFTFPARHTVEVSRLPLDALIEISCVAALTPAR